MISFIYLGEVWKESFYKLGGISEDENISILELDNLFVNGYFFISGFKNFNINI